MSIRDVLARMYLRRLRAQLRGRELPKHVAVIMDGNRRWARAQGFADARVGHDYGAEHISSLLRWCAAAGIEHVTIFVCSTENLIAREQGEVNNLLTMMERMVARELAVPDPQWQVHLAGLIDALPDTTARALKEAQSSTAVCTTGQHLTLAIGYGGRQEVVDAVRSLLLDEAAAGVSAAELARRLTTDDIAQHLYTSGQPEPDLIIRTSGEQRLSNFLLWQSERSQLYFCEAYWPAFREIDLLRALRGWSAYRNTI